MPGRVAALLIALAVVVTIVAVVWRMGAGGDEPPAAGLAERDRTYETNDPLKRACDLGPRVLLRLWRGHHNVHSEDVTTVPQPPNYSGSFNVTSHSGPWSYVQTIPLVVYGPGYVESQGHIRGHASIADVYATIGELAGVELPERSGHMLFEGSGTPPKLIVTVVWDGVGRNTLEVHPDAWPNLKRLEQDGVSYLDATVGSSPSITPATHSTLGTGAFPRDHGVTAIEYRTEEGDVRSAFAGKNPADLALTTIADEIDRSLGNQPKVGMLAWKSWHLGMFSHGTNAIGGDADELALINTHGDITGNETFYSFPRYLTALRPRLKELADEVDAADGKRDGKTRGHDVLDKHDNPAWVDYQADLMLEMLRRGDYGKDSVPDLFFTNFKVTDIVSHQHSMDSEEEAIALEAQDAVLGDLVDFLNVQVHDFVLIVTADHGNTPSPERSGAWPILQGQLEEDVNAHFEVPKGKGLIEKTSAAGPFLDVEVMQELGATPNDVARFLNGYTIADNWNAETLPEGYEERGDEHVFAAAYPSDDIDEVMDCAFGGRPPEDLEA